MLTSLAFIFIIGLIIGGIFQLLKLPRLIGFLITGILIGPYALNLLDDSILSISSQLRQMALIIILLKAGLSLNLSDLKRVGRPAIMMSFIPASFEIIGYVLLAPVILKISYLDGAIMGAVLAAVSPAVVVPRMVQLIDNNYGTNKSIPQLILAGASLDDIFVIVLFTTFSSMAQGGSVNIMDFVNIPISIILGVILGSIVGYLVSYFFELTYKLNHNIRCSNKVLIILATSFLLMAIETWLSSFVAISGLLAIVAMACIIKMKSSQVVTSRLSEKFGKLWLGAEVLLFVLVGAAVDIRYTMNAGSMAILMIFLALMIRSLGVLLCLLKTNLNIKERVFTIIAYLPKATVQAAIGSIPLSMGLGCGSIVLSVAVLGILITAPLGAIAIDLSYRQLLTNSNISNTDSK